MNSRDKLKGVFDRFIIWAKDSKIKYKELDDLFDSFIKTTNFNLFIIGITTSPEFEPIREICQNADEDFQTQEIKKFIKIKMEELLVTTIIDEKDESGVVTETKIVAITNPEEIFELFEINTDEDAESVSEKRRNTQNFYTN